MSNERQYTPRFYAWLKAAEKHIADLPSEHQALIVKFEQAKQAWQEADSDTQNKLLLVLVHADAIIAANIYRLYGNEPEESQVDKVKLMALKAKALSFKWKKN